MVPNGCSPVLSEPHVDVLVNNAGIAPFASIDDMDVDSFDQLSAVNMRSVFFVTQKVLPRLRSRRPHHQPVVRRCADRIPRHAGILGNQGLRRRADAASGSRTRFAPDHGECRRPGVIETRLTTGLLENGGAEAVQSMQALAGIAGPERVAGVVSFLAGPDGAWTTGQVIDVSGGTKL
jgi:3-oxoacyl-[acyl-carrier protein] reductase